MQTLAILSKSTKQGLSVWRFGRLANGGFAATGGHQADVKEFDTIEELRSCYAAWVRMGYTIGMPTPKPVKVTKAAKPYISDPWSSTLPAQMQMELEALTA